MFLSVFFCKMIYSILTMFLVQGVDSCMFDFRSLTTHNIIKQKKGRCDIIHLNSWISGVASYKNHKSQAFFSLFETNHHGAHVIAQFVRHDYRSVRVDDTSCEKRKDEMRR